MRSAKSAPTRGATDDVWAVGHYIDVATYATLLLHWDGSAWTVVTTPDPSTYSILDRVWATSAKDVWAVGHYSIGSTGIRTLVKHYACPMTCPLQFADVPSTNTFYPYVRCLVCRGIVRAKREEGGQKLVDLEIWTENPQGQKTTPGTATVRLFN